MNKLYFVISVCCIFRDFNVIYNNIFYTFIALNKFVKIKIYIDFLNILFVLNYAVKYFLYPIYKYITYAYTCYLLKS